MTIDDKTSPGNKRSASLLLLDFVVFRT